MNWRAKRTAETSSKTVPVTASNQIVTLAESVCSEQSASVKWAKPSSQEAPYMARKGKARAGRESLARTTAADPKLVTANHAR